MYMYIYIYVYIYTHTYIYTFVCTHAYNIHTQEEKDSRKQLLVCTVMELCEHGDLACKLHDMHTLDSKLSETEARQWVSTLV